MSKLFYPEATKWMWNYCINLGKFTDSQGQEFDLGIHISFNGQTAYNTHSAAVYSNDAGSYISGELRINNKFNDHRLGLYTEIIKRAKAKGLVYDDYGNSNITKKQYNLIVNKQNHIMSKLSFDEFCELNKEQIDFIGSSHEAYHYYLTDDYKDGYFNETKPFQFYKGIDRYGNAGYFEDFEQAIGE